MAWEEQRRLRDARGGDTAKIEGLPVASAPAGRADDRPRRRRPRRRRAGPPAPSGGASGSAGWPRSRSRWSRWSSRCWRSRMPVPRRPPLSDAAPARFAPYGRPGGGFGGAYPPGFGPGSAPPR